VTSPLATADLVWLRSAADNYLPDVAYVRRQTFTDDDEGGQERGVPVLLGPYPCAVYPFSKRRPGTEQVTAGQFLQNAEWTILFPAGTDVTAKDEITVGARVFDVLFLLAPESWEAQRQVVCVERLT
jgi:hypothetical protein